jgi:ArsR family transcriptional regulator
MSDSFDLAAADPQAAERAVALLKALSHLGRLRILCTLLERPMSVSEICAALDEPQASVSQHLMRLRAERLVSRSRMGKSIRYQIEGADVAGLIGKLRQMFCPT